MFNYLDEFEKARIAWLEYTRQYYRVMGHLGEEKADRMMEEIEELCFPEIDRMSTEAYEKLGFEIVRR